MKTYRKRKSEKGQSLVELTLTFMIVMFVLAGTVDLGRAFFALIALKDAATEGATYASLNPTDTSDIIARVRASADNPIDMSDTTNVSVSVTTPDGVSCRGFDVSTGKHNGITVTVTSIFHITMPLMSTVVSSDSFPLTASMTHSILYPQC